MNENKGQRPIKRALISVFYKDGLLELVAALAKSGVELVSTGSTAKTIADAGYEVKEVQAVTGFAEILDGRVKTLHPHIHAGLLADLSKDEHAKTLQELNIEPFDLVVSNLYPFEETVRTGGSFEQIVEKIDIGGPAMVRSAAKNFNTCAVVVDPKLYAFTAQAVLQGGFTLAERQALSALAFSQIADYDQAISEWTWEQAEESILQLINKEPIEPAAQAELADLDPFEFEKEMLERTFNFSPTEQQELGLEYLRYGENSHQRAYVQQTTAFSESEIPLAMAPLLNGKAMSYNNYVDADAALRAVYDFAQPAVAIIKHNNPSGLAIADDIASAYQKAYATDPVSAFGGVVAANRPVSLAMAQQLAAIFTEVLVAPGFEAGALEVLRQKKNLRILQISGSPQRSFLLEERQIWGGQLVQEKDLFQAAGDDPKNWELVCGEQVAPAVLQDLAFAWRAVRAPKSNAIVLAKDLATVGIGMGQVNRVDSCKLAIERANTLMPGHERAKDSVAASDAFFPFADGPSLLIAAGIKAIVQPGGSIRDQEVIAACEEAGISMYFTSTRHFSH